MQKFLAVSERMHAGLILLAELASSDQARSLRDIGEVMHLSEGYLEEIAALLRKAGFIQGKRGAGGGYALAIDPAKVTLHQILVALDGPIALVPCQHTGDLCSVAHLCKTRNVWSSVQQKMISFLQETTLASVLTSSYPMYA